MTQQHQETDFQTELNVEEVVKAEAEAAEQAVENAENIAEESIEQPNEMDLQQRINELEAYIAEADKREQDIVLRARAEVENIRRRAEQDVEKAHKFALEKFSKELLNVVDNLERAMTSLENADENTKNLVEGVQLTHKELVSVLGRFGVEAVGSVGDEFNPELHQAISMQPAEGIEANHISVVLQKGYTLQGRVLRPAMVMVAN